MKASDRQEGGQHYKSYAIQPAEFVQRNNLNWCEGNAIKYLVRHRDKKGAEDLLKAKHYIDLLLEWEYPAPEGLPADRKASLCHSCHVDACTVQKITACEETDACPRYVSALRENMLDAKQEAPTASVLPLDFTLPSIALKCTAGEAWKKYESELLEWADTEDNSTEELVERWDCIHALRTYYERGGDVKEYQYGARIIMEEISKWYAEGRDVMGAKADCLLKNAERGYYSPEVNAAIIASKGHRFQPLDEMGVI